MDRVARDMLRQALRPDHGQTAGAMDQRVEKREACRGADQRQLEHVELAHCLTAGNGDDQHQGEPAGHPQRGHRFGGGAIHRPRYV